MTSINTMKQAIEALNEAVAFREGGRQKAIDAITALRTAIQQAEAKTDVRCEGCGYMTHHREHMGCVRAAKQFTHPAPGVPDDVVRDAERYRWLRQRVAASNPRGEGSWAYHYCQFPRPTSNPCYGNVSDNWGLDIDAAIAASQAQKGEA